MASLLLLVTLLSVSLQPLPLTAADEVCNNLFCSITETTVNDFAKGTFYFTGIRNIGDGEVQLIPIGLTSPWTQDPYTLPAARAELAAALYRDAQGRETIYAIGGVDNLVNPRTEIFTATIAANGNIEAPGWRTATHSPLDIPLASTQAVISPTASGGFLYVLGGLTSGGVATSTILFKPLNAAGVLPTGAWNRAELPPSPAPGDPLYWHQAFVRNGYLYVVGGANEYGNPVAEIYRAPIQSNGTLGAWIADTNSPITRGAFGIAIWNSEEHGDWLYLIGGLKQKYDSVGQAQVDYAQFNSDGSLGSFTTNVQSALPAPRYGHTSLQAAGVLYTIGGDQGGSGAASITNTVLSGLIDSRPGYVGQLAFPWITTNPLAEGRKYHASVISRIGQVYVIGGYGPASGGGTEPKNTVFHGSTSGVGSTFAPRGKYESRVINRATNRAITEINVNATLTQTTGMTLTMQYRAANDLAALLAKPWTTLGNMDTGTPTAGITKTFHITDTDRPMSLIQYRAIYTTENNSYSPILNAFEVRYYPPPTPTNIDFTITGIGTPPQNSTPTTQTIVVRVSNIGTQNFNTTSSSLALPPTLRTAPTRPQPGSGSRLIVPRAVPSGISHYVWVDVYIDPSPPPSVPYPSGNCMDISGVQKPGLQYIELRNLAAGQSVDLEFKCYVTTTGTHNYYAQVDTCWDV
ncbi:MAG: hypothetical protein N2559_15390, partial [Anaerolineae bacterium]|nr:hypothetical protein [Anaerolineae bacterium]